MAKKAYVFEFPNGQKIPNSVLGPEDLQKHILDAADISGAKIAENRILPNGQRRVKVKFPTSEEEMIFDLACNEREKQIIERD